MEARLAAGDECAKAPLEALYTARQPGAASHWAYTYGRQKRLRLWPGWYFYDANRR